MKRINLLLLLLAGWISITVSCHKPDWPRKKCQISIFIDSSETFGQKYHYMYNDKRLMDSMTIGSTFSPATSLRIGIEHNNQNRPVSVGINNINYYKYVYQQGRIIRIDELGMDNQYHPFINFVYDSRGRIIERSGGLESLRWEYIGASNNFKRRLTFNGGDFTNPSLIYEYTYDNKVNPWSTWPNTILNPFFQPLNDIYQVFEPIPENNILYEGVTGKLADGSPFKYREIFYTYTYDEVYPVSRTARHLFHDPLSGQTQETRGAGHYSYECAGDAH